MTAVFLKKGRDHSVRNRHPWIFSGAIDRLEGEAAPGDIVLVRDAAGEALGLGSYSPASQIRIRMLAFDPTAELGDDLFLADALGRALRARERLLKTGAVNALRVVNAEADLLPGVTVDRYGDWYVGQFTTAGADRRKELIATILLNLWPAKGFFERSDAASLSTSATTARPSPPTPPDATSSTSSPTRAASASPPSRPGRSPSRTWTSPRRPWSSQSATSR